MENFEEHYCRTIPLNFDTEDKVVFDYVEGIICAIRNNSLVVYEDHDIETGSVHKINTTENLKYVKYLTAYNIVFLATDNELFLYNIESKSVIVSKRTENPIIALSWNYLETLIVIIDRNNDIISYSCTKNFIDKKSKCPLGAEVPIPVLVGWGSKKTQFQGPKQKLSCTDIFAEACERVIDSPPTISWRGNSELFVVNYFQNEQRFLKVFDAQLNPLNQSEPYTNLQAPVGFMGKGQCIACCSVVKGENKLVIFEKNCKVKAEYDVSEITGTITKLLYHPLMNMLAISFVDKNMDSFINVYLFSNGNWFLKQQLYYPVERKLQDFRWHHSDEHSFTKCKLIVFTSQEVEYNEFRFGITRSLKSATVVVVNGRYLEFYLFDKKITPPPMCYGSFKHNRAVNMARFHPSRNLCICIDSLYQIKLLSINDEGVIEDYGTVNNYSLLGMVKFSSLKFTNKAVLLTLFNDFPPETHSSQIKEMSIVVKTEKREHPGLELPFSDTVMLLPPKTLSRSNQYIYLTKHIVEVDGELFEYEFALSSYREFFVNDVNVCLGVTSFYIFKDYLIFTHTCGQLFCIRLKDHNAYKCAINLSKTFSREIEQGGIIISCTNYIFPQIILQMPRGNLEVIGCKLITIDVVESMLQENRWTEVLQILRTEKVNWNVLIDLNPVRFNAHIPNFVKVCKNNTILSNIVTEFNTIENCFTTFYKNYLSVGCYIHHYDKKKIINNILKYLVTTDCINNLSSIVAIQQKHISLKSALKSINDIYKHDRDKNEKVCSKIIKQLMSQEHFKDIESAAYNLFDLDFLTLIYFNSSEDPKIYEAEIRSYRTMGPIEMRFKMSIRGRNLKGSVKYLLRSDTVDESFITNFLIKNRLENVAYLSIEPFHLRFKQVSLLYSNRLSILKRYVEAGMILKRASLYNEALQEYKKGLEWREVTSLCSLLDMSEEASKKIYKDLATELVKENRLDEAVILLETYNKDPKAAIDVLVEKNSYRKAICLAETYKEFNLIDEEILPKLSEYLIVLKDKINTYREQFEKYADRLTEVREERATKLHAYAIGQINDPDDDLYSQSDLSSVSSKSSRNTSKSRSSTASARNKRKEDRKKIDLKVGGFYEDIALIRALYILYTEVFAFSNEIKEICLICEKNYSLDVPRNLHKLLSELQNNLVKRIPEIWSDAFVKEEGSNEFTVKAMMQNKKDLEVQYHSPPALQNIDSWKLEVFL